MSGASPCLATIAKALCRSVYRNIPRTGTAPQRVRREALRVSATVRLALLVAASAALAVVGVCTFSSQAASQSALLSVLTTRVTLTHHNETADVVEERVVQSGDRIRTDASGRALITYRDGSSLLLDTSSELVIELIQHEDGSVLVRIRQTLGRAWYSISRSLSVGSRFEVRTLAMASVIRAGSGSLVVVTPDGETTVVATEGTVEADAAGVSRTVAAGNSTTAAVGSAPSSPEPVATPVVRPTAHPSATPTATPSATATPTSTPTWTVKDPSASSSPVPSPSPDPSPSPTPSPTPQPTPGPEPLPLPSLNPNTSEPPAPTPDSTLPPLTSGTR